MSGALAVEFLKKNLVIIDETGSRPDESHQVVTQWLEKYLNASAADQIDFKLLSHHITVKLARLEDGPVYVKSFELVPVLEGKPTSCASVSGGVVLSGVPADCAMSGYRKVLYKFLYETVLSHQVALELPEGYRVAARDILNHSASISFVGSTYWTNEDAIRAMLQNNVFKSNRVAVVRDLFDRHLKTRPHLDHVLFSLSPTSFAVSETVLGLNNTKRRLVQEYTYNVAEGLYELSVNDMELGEYLVMLGFQVVPVPASLNASSISMISLSHGKFVASACQAELAAFYKTQPTFKGEISVLSDPEFSFEVLANSFLIREPSTNFAASNAIKPVSEIPRVHLPIKAYQDAKKRQTTNKLLMVAPIGFLSSAQTALDNYFMNKTSLPEYEVERLALAEYSAFHRALVAEGVCINLYRNERFYNTPDAVFPNNWFSTHPPAEDTNEKSPKSALILYPMKAPSRRAERREHIATDLMSKYEKVENLTYFEYQGMSGAAFEGTGSLVLDRVNKVAYCALSQRADVHVFHLWCKKMGYAPCVFNAEDDKGRPVYHTNVVMGLCSSIAVVCLESVPDAAQRANLKTTLAVHHTVVAITRAQMNNFCGNVLEVQGSNESRLLIMSSRAFAAFTPDQHEVFARHVKKIVHVPVPTIEDIGGGGVRCMMGELF